MRGLVKNWDSLKQINTENYDVLIFNEIWQVRNFEYINITGFKIANIYQRELQKGGGVVIYIRDNIKTETIESPIVTGVIETTSIILNNNIITAIYRPPSGNKQVFVEKLTDWITSLNNKNIYIAGDFNLNYLNNNKEYYDTIESITGLKVNITEITRTESSSCIDNILTNLTGTHKVNSICIADHQAMTSQIRATIQREPQKRYKYREMKECNWSTFATEVSKLKIRGIDINEKWNNLTSDIKMSVEKSFPERESKIKYKFTMSQGLLKSKNKKNKLLKQYKRGQIDKEIYIRYNKIYRKLIVKEQEKTFHDRILETGQDYKKKWSVLKSELKLNEEREDIKSIRANGSLYTGKFDIANKFKIHFETCAINLANGVPNSGDCEILINQQENWEFNAINEKELIKVIDSILPKSSCGFDLLSNRMLKKEKLKFSRLLLNLINETIKSKIFPDALKIARVIPIFKKGDRTNLNNYRPISLLPVLSKILEKIINNQITKKLDELHLIDDNQYGFRTGHSTEDAVLKFIDYIEKAKKSIDM